MKRFILELLVVSIVALTTFVYSAYIPNPVPSPGVPNSCVNRGYNASTFYYPFLFANLPSETDGLVVYCADCTSGSSPCTGSGHGALAIGENGAFKCF